MIFSLLLSTVLLSPARIEVDSSTKSADQLLTCQLLSDAREPKSQKIYFKKGSLVTLNFEDTEVVKFDFSEQKGEVPVSSVKRYLTKNKTEKIEVTMLGGVAELELTIAKSGAKRTGKIKFENKVLKSTLKAPISCD